VTGPQRERLAEAQSRLLHALLADGPAPAGFDRDRLQVEATALLSKRRRVVAMLQSEACGDLGDRFVPLFGEYGRTHPRRIGTRARDDAREFVEWCLAQGHLDRPRKRRWPFRRATEKRR
jgi:hypothetical protein